MQERRDSNANALELRLSLPNHRYVSHTDIDIYQRTVAHMLSAAEY